MESTADYINFIDDAAKQQQRAVREQFLLGAAVLVIGVLLVLIAQFYTPTDSKLFLQIGGGFISSLASLRISPLVTRRRRIAALSFLRAGFERMARNELGDEEAERVRERFWKYIDASLS